MQLYSLFILIQLFKTGELCGFDFHHIFGAITIFDSKLDNQAGHQLKVLFEII